MFFFLILIWSYAFLLCQIFTGVLFEINLFSIAISLYISFLRLIFFKYFQSFLDYFARALQYEYKDSGVIVQSLMPFYVATRMTRYSKTLSKPSLMIPSAEDYARSAVATLGYTSRTSGYWPHTLQVISYSGVYQSNIRLLATYITGNLLLWGIPVEHQAIGHIRYR